MKTAQDMIDYINKRLNHKVINNVYNQTQGLALSKNGEDAIKERWNKTEANGGYSEGIKSFI